MYWRVFGTNDTTPSPAGLLEHLHGNGLEVRGDFRGDDLGWTSVTLTLPGGGSPVPVERFLTVEDDLRHELNSWVGWLETCDYSPNAEQLIDIVTGTSQLYTLRRPVDHPNDAALDLLCTTLCEWLARQTEGIYQVDNRGFLDAQGTMLLEEY